MFGSTVRLLVAVKAIIVFIELINYAYNDKPRKKPNK
jgi:hypothetical protein